jgi:hypothetical protein
MLVKNSDMRSKRVSPIKSPTHNLVRLANRLKALTMTQYSSDEDSENGDRQRPSPALGEKKPASTNGLAFAEVVRASMKAKEEANAAAAAAAAAAARAE